MRRAHGRDARGGCGTGRAAKQPAGDSRVSAACRASRRPQRIELREVRCAFHGASDRHGPGARGIGVVEALLDAATLQAARDEGGVETVACAGGVDLLHEIGRPLGAALTAVVGGAPRPLLDDDLADSQREDLLYRFVGGRRVRQHRQLIPAG